MSVRFYEYLLYDPFQDGFITVDECKIDCSMVFICHESAGDSEQFSREQLADMYNAGRASEKTTLDDLMLVSFWVPGGDTIRTDFTTAMSVKDFMMERNRKLNDACPLCTI